MCPCLTPGPFSLSQASHLLTTPPGAWIGGSPRPVLLASLQQSAFSWVLCESSFVWSSVVSFLSPLINVSEKAFDLEWMYLWASSEKFYGVTQRFPMLWRLRGIFQIWFWAESNLFLSGICCQAVSSLECEACDEGRLTFLYLILTTVSETCILSWLYSGAQSTLKAHTLGHDWIRIRGVPGDRRDKIDTAWRNSIFSGKLVTKCFKII